MNKADIKVCVGLSGGVDSSVAAYLLKKEGYDVFAMFMQNWSDAGSTLHGDCEWEEDRFIAEMVARKIGIPFYFVNLSEEYRQRVVDYMFSEYEAGRTPNPDVLCNREIKFDAFVKVARKMGADMVATGHYVRKVPANPLETVGEPMGIFGQPIGTSGQPMGTSGQPMETSLEPREFRLLEGADPNKDQSYFLCQLTQEQLAKALFPIGDLTKPEVRKIAADADLPSAEKKDSQGICFVGKVDLPTFLKQKLAPKEGDVVEVYDAWYGQDSLYLRQQEILGRLLRQGVELERTVRYAPEEKVLTSDGEPLGECPFDLDGNRNGKLDGNRNGKLDGNRNGKLNGNRNGKPGENGESDGNPGGISDEELETLSRPLEYHIDFQTETYRSGKKHIKKTRYKDNPYGEIVGKHDGAQFYTIGQRKGLGIGGHADPVFVISTDTETNTVYVGEGHDHKGLSRFCLKIAPDQVHWIRPGGFMRVGENRRYRVRIRYRQPLQSATLLMREGGLYILFDKPQRGISPGQFAVWYDGEEVIGSGVIA